MNNASESQPILELNIQPLIHAITTMRAFKDNIILHHSLGMPIITMVSSIEAYTLSPWNKTNSCNNACPDAPHTNPTFLAPNLLPPTATRYLILLRGISVTPQHLRMDQSHLQSNARKSNAR
jgi:hypothetical protein